MLRPGGEVFCSRPLLPVQYFAVVIWHGEMALLDPPAIVCRAWHPTEDPDLDGDEADLELELRLHEWGWRMCDCFSRYVPAGEFGHISARRTRRSRPTSSRATIG